MLNDIYDAIKRADTVIGGLLDFSRPRTLILKPEVLNELVIQTVALIRHDASKKQIVMEQNFADGLPEVMLDGNKMKQVLLNLLMMVDLETWYA